MWTSMFQNFDIENEWLYVGCNLVWLLVEKCEPTLTCGEKKAPANVNHTLQANNQVFIYLASCACVQSYVWCDTFCILVKNWFRKALKWFCYSF